jgi:hypothetical protein
MPTNAGQGQTGQKVARLGQVISPLCLASYRGGPFGPESGPNGPEGHIPTCRLMRGWPKRARKWPVWAKAADRLSLAPIRQARTTQVAFAHQLRKDFDLRSS